MEINGQVGRRIVLFSLVAMILPLLAFPTQFGTQLTRASLFSIMYELAFYGVVVWLFHRRTTLVRLVSSAGICLIYRLTLSAVFGLLLAVLYGMNVRISLTMGLSAYLPSILFHIALAPFILKPVIDSFYDMARRAPRVRPMAPPESSDPGPTRAEVVRQGRTVSSTPSSVPRPVKSWPSPEPAAARQFPDPIPAGRSAREAVDRSGPEVDGFDRAVAYIGEHRSVQLAAVVDKEGLLLANFQRGDIDAEEWAPLALVFLEANRLTLQRGELEGLERLNLGLKTKRLVIADADSFCLMVLSERQDDDLLGIRINQGLEMINKYVAERYGDKLNPNAETINVPSA
jgi:predicted regulator of Ras-like GTPase activity (Roadblock/LC7/MglB family)